MFPTKRVKGAVLPCPRFRLSRHRAAEEKRPVPAEDHWCTGALRLGVDAGFGHKIYLIGYNDADSKPIGCSTRSTEFDSTQMQSYCNDYRNGTSGGPWILNFNHVTGTGIVFGDIGGYEQGGGYPYLSYSPYYSSSILLLFQQVQRRS
jgi:hypothetical protein